MLPEQFRASFFFHCLPREAHIARSAITSTRLARGKTRIAAQSHGIVQPVDPPYQEQRPLREAPASSHNSYSVSRYRVKQRLRQAPLSNRPLTEWNDTHSGVCAMEESEPYQPHFGGPELKMLR